MKINQIVSEHKKGVRAMKYAKKPQNTIAPKKPQKPVAVGKEVNEEAGEAYQVQKSGPEGTTLINPATKVQMQLPPELAANMVQDKTNPKQFNLSQQAVTPPAAGAPAAPAGPQMGDTVNIQAGGTMGMGEDGEEMAPPPAPEATDVPMATEAMSEVDELYNDWMSSEYAPMDDESGDDRAVMRKAMHFLHGQVPSGNLKKLAMMFAHQFHGSGLDDEMDEVQSPYPSRNAGTPAASQAQEPTKPVQSAVYPSRNSVQEAADNALLDKMRTIAGLR